MFLRPKKSKTDLVKERIQELSESVADLANDLSVKAAVALAPRVETARGAASSTSTRVREEYAARVRDAAVPAIAAALARAQVQDEQDEQVQEEQPKKHRLRKLLMILGLGGAAAYAAKKFGLGGQSQPSFGQTSPSGSSYAGTMSSTPPARPSAVPDARDAADPLQGGGAAGAGFADSETELGRDVTGEFSEEQDFDTRFTTTPPTEATSEESGTGSQPKPTT